jgi:hypothetical protein
MDRSLRGGTASVNGLEQYVLTADLNSAVEGVTSRPSGADNPHVAIAQVSKRQLTSVAMWWSAR